MDQKKRLWSGSLLLAALCAGCGGGDGGGGKEAPAMPEQTTGGATFAVDGNALQFDALPSGHNYYTQLASQVTVRPRVDAAEQLSITFASIDLRKLELAAMAGVGFSYRTEDGVEWAGPGKIRIDRFGRDGVIVGSFDDVSLPHTDKQLPNITLTAGTFRAQISSPW